MKVRICVEELHPVYILCDRERDLIEVPQEQVEKWKAARKAFDEAQDEMKEIYWTQRGAT